MMKQAQAAMDRLGLDLNLAIKVLIIAVVSGLLGGLLDVIISLPVGVLAFAFGWFLAALNGASYAFYRGREDLGGIVMAALAGLVTALLWFIIVSLIGDDLKDLTEPNQHAYLVDWFEELNILKALIGGVLVGLLGFGWFALLRRLPNLPFKV
jgi:hypothetical protein